MMAWTRGHKVGSFSGTNLYITYAGGNGNDVTLFSRAVPRTGSDSLSPLGSGALTAKKRAVGQV